MARSTILRRGVRYRSKSRRAGHETLRLLLTHCGRRWSKPFALQESFFDHLVGSPEQRDREGEAERLGGLHVDNQFDPRGLLHRQVGGLLTLENAAGIGADQSVRVQATAAVAHQAAGRGERAILVDRGHSVAERRWGELFVVCVEEYIVADHERACR
jgi:ribosomal protein L27